MCCISNQVAGMSKCYGVMCWHPGRMALVGFMFGPVSHVWYKYLDRWLPLANFSTVVKKVCVDQVVASPVFLAYFFFGMNSSHCH